MSTLLELADRVEALVTSDRALDAEIAYVIRWRWEDWEEGDICIEDLSLEYVVNSTLNSNNSIWKYLPACTASLDAALTLVPDQAGYEIRRATEKDFARVYVELWWMPTFPHKQQGSGATPALALTAASLRAINSIRRTA